MSRRRAGPLAVYHEHPDWFRPLFAELDRRGIPWLRLDAASHSYDPGELDVPWPVVFNRASPSAYLRQHGQSTFHTLHWLRHLQGLGVPVVNGADVYALELSKATQLHLLRSLGLRAPRSRVINAAGEARDAARGLRFPVLVKANVGGSGAGITRFDSTEDLRRAVADGKLEFGPDGTALVQEAAPLAGGHITRVETLGGKYLYAIDVYPATGSFDLCPADACQTTGGRELVRGACALDAPRNGLRVEAATPPLAIIDAVERIAREADLDVGGIEYLIDDRDGEAYFYDINALSNFVADAPNVIGFDPFARLVDYLEERIAAVTGPSLTSIEQSPSGPSLTLGTGVR
ncbi:MAG TPA: hypothetical protein VGL65_05855 [Gemmatimonadales bacterium]|jgi:hypothetical protein